MFGIRTYAVLGINTYWSLHTLLGFTNAATHEPVPTLGRTLLNTTLAGQARVIESAMLKDRVTGEDREVDVLLSARAATPGHPPLQFVLAKKPDGKVTGYLADADGLQALVADSATGTQ